MRLQFLVLSFLWICKLRLHGTDPLVGSRWLFSISSMTWQSPWAAVWKQSQSLWTLPGKPQVWVRGWGSHWRKAGIHRVHLIHCVESNDCLQRAQKKAARLAWCPQQAKTALGRWRSGSSVLPILCRFSPLRLFLSLWSTATHLDKRRLSCRLLSYLQLQLSCNCWGVTNHLMSKLRLSPGPSRARLAEGRIPEDPCLLMHPSDSTGIFVFPLLL